MSIIYLKSLKFLKEGGIVVGKEGRHKKKFNLFFKDFESVRDIVRSAFLYGGYSKKDYCKLVGISMRKYEDTLRFMQAVFAADYFSYQNKGKEKYAALNYKAFEDCTNPLARLAFFKGFTENDFNCYFYLLDILSEHLEGLTIDEIADKIAEYNKNLNTIGTIRNAINALVDEGYLIRARRGRKDYYSLSEDILSKLSDEELTILADFIMFVKDIHNQRIPLYTLADKLPESNFGNKVKLTDYYPVQVLDAEVKNILEVAIIKKCIVKFTYTDSKRLKIQIENAAPLRIVTGDYGRQYVLCFVDYNTSGAVFRLDRIGDLELTKMTFENNFYESYLDKVWCVSIPKESALHYIEIKFDFGGDKMLANRLNNSKKFGEVTEVNGIHHFAITVKDYGEMLPMIRSFYGYIIWINDEELKNSIKEDVGKIGGAYGIV